jgi:hypothetical protein
MLLLFLGSVSFGSAIKDFFEIGGPDSTTHAIPLSLLSWIDFFRAILDLEALTPTSLSFVSQAASLLCNVCMQYFHFSTSFAPGSPALDTEACARMRKPVNPNFRSNGVMEKRNTSTEKCSISPDHHDYHS